MIQFIKQSMRNEALMIINSQSLMQIKPCVYYNQIYDNKFLMQMHKHNSLEIMYVRSGFMILHYVNVEEKKINFTLSQGQFVLIPPMLSHKISFEKTQSNILNIEFESRTPTIKIENLFLKNDITKSFPIHNQLFKDFKTPLIFNDTNKFLQKLVNLHEVLDFEFSTPQFELMYTLNISQLITSILLCECQSINKKSGNHYIKKASLFIQQNLHKDLSISQIATVAGCSIVYLERLFKSFYDTTIRKKINELRIERAKYLLKQSNQTIREIGYNIGFSSPQSFINNFKALTKTTPKDYKQDVKQNYTQLHAYEQAYFDEKFNRFIPFAKNTMLINQSINDCLNNDNTNCFLYSQRTNLKKSQAIALKNNAKYIFVDANLFKNDKKKLESFINTFDRLELSPFFVGLYVRNDNSEILKATLEFIHKNLPNKRIIFHPTNDQITNELNNDVTDLVITNGERHNGIKQINIWLYLPYTDEGIREAVTSLNNTTCEGVVYYSVC
ncbi:MAG: helix-turn-helix transcriptional regulator [Clostridiales bacterium]|nr:helix-turn-helix transcriptional regulator [Clostridiales bacterium]